MGEALKRFRYASLRTQKGCAGCSACLQGAACCLAAMNVAGLSAARIAT